MILTSKRITVALLTIAAFTGVLLKEIPFTSPDEDKVGGTLAVDNTLSDVAVLSTAGEQIQPPRQQAEVVQSSPTFSGFPTLSSDPMDGASLSDIPMLGHRPGLPNPVGASAGSFSSRGTTPFLPAGKANLNSGNGGSGGGGSGGGGSGGGGGSNPPGSETPPSNGGFVPGDGNPGDSKNNPPSENNSPTLPQPPTDNSDNNNPPPTGGDDFKSPPINDNPGAPIIPPWTDAPLPDAGGDTPDTDFPNPPSDGPTHHVPDSGSSAVLIALAFGGLLAVGRRLGIR